MLGTLTPLTRSDFEASSAELLASMRARAGDDPRIPDIKLIAAPKGPAEALLDASRSADLLVVGSRGLGGFRSLLGSVSQQCAHHALCPVVVVHSPVRPADSAPQDAAA
jgi:nucleotide-binding universal stress UspA family protein